MNRALHDLADTGLDEGGRSRRRSVVLNSPNRYSFAGQIDERRVIAVRRENLSIFSLLR